MNQVIAVMLLIVISLLTGGVVMHVIWKRRFAKAVWQTSQLKIKHRDEQIRDLKVQVEKAEIEADMWHRRALVSLRAVKLD